MEIIIKKKEKMKLNFTRKGKIAGNLHINIEWIPENNINIVTNYNNNIYGSTWNML